MDIVARRWTKGKKKPAISNGFFTFLDFPGLCNGGGAGNRINHYPIEYIQFIATLLYGYTHIYTHKKECCFLFFSLQ
jgi:hypothetical protein